MTSYMSDRMRWSPEERKKERTHRDKDRDREKSGKDRDREKHSHKSREKHGQKHREKDRYKGTKQSDYDRERHNPRRENHLEEDYRDRSRNGTAYREEQEKEGREETGRLPSRSAAGEFPASTSSNSIVNDLRNAALEQLRKRTQQAEGSEFEDPTDPKRRRYSPSVNEVHDRDKPAASRWSSENGARKDRSVSRTPPYFGRDVDDGRPPLPRSSSKKSLNGMGPSTSGAHSSDSENPERAPPTRVGSVSRGEAYSDSEAGSDGEEGEIKDEVYAPKPSRWRVLGELGEGIGNDDDISDTEREAIERQYEEMQAQATSNTMFGSGNMPSSRWTEDMDDEETKELTKQEKLESALAAATGDYERDLNKKELAEIEDEGVEEGVLGNSSDDEAEELVSPQTQQRIHRVNMLNACRSVEEFERLNCIDEGAYGVVYRARDKKSGNIVALKKVKMEKEKDGMPMTAIREMNILLSFHHPNIVNVSEVVMGNSLDSIFMAMEFMEHDLKGLADIMKHPFSVAEVKTLMLQLLEGVAYLHDNWVLHRDLKTSNILYGNDGTLKICDFGLARQYGSPLKAYTNLVVTLWYRAPELLLGEKIYSTAIDIWSLGCIMGELLLKEPLLNGQSELAQLDKMFKLLGTPVDPPIGVQNDWPGYRQMKNVKSFQFQSHPNQLRKKFPATSFTGGVTLSESGFDLLCKLLKYDPNQRISAAEALEHPWFQEHPPPKPKELMPTYPTRKEGLARKGRKYKSPDPLKPTAA